MTRAQRLLGVTFPTASKAIHRLVGLGLLTELTGQQRNRVYRSRPVFDAVYREHPEIGDEGPGAVATT